MKKLWTLISRWAKKNTPAVLRPRATEKAIESLENQLCTKMPAEFRESYLLHNGFLKGRIFYEALLCDGVLLMPVDEILSTWTMLKELFDSGDFDDAQANPGRGVKPHWWHPQWIPISDDGVGNHHCIDLHPSPEGKLGQIILFVHDDEERRVVASSFAAWLEQIADDMETKSVAWSNEHGAVVAADMIGPSEPALVASSLLKQAREQFRAKHWMESVDSYEKARMAASGTGVQFENSEFGGISFACSQFGDYERALYYANYALDIATSMAPAGRSHFYHFRGMAHLGLGEVDKAFVDATEAVNSNAYTPENFELRAEILNRLGDHEGAKADRARAKELLS